MLRLAVDDFTDFFATDFFIGALDWCLVDARAAPRNNARAIDRYQKGSEKH
jgi:hypothetical protein